MSLISTARKLVQGFDSGQDVRPMVEELRKRLGDEFKQYDLVEVIKQVENFPEVGSLGYVHEVFDDYILVGFTRFSDDTPILYKFKRGELRVR